MSNSSKQLGLFESDASVDQVQEAYARTRMRAMIDKLKPLATPPWQDEMGPILDDGSFQRAMRMVPADEAKALWAEFDLEMDRLYSIWTGKD